MRLSRRLLPVLAILVLVAAALPTASLAQTWQIESKDGQSSLRFGLLAQARYEAIDTPDGEDTTQNLFLRRLRILMSGKLNENWSFFLETDSPNLGKSAAGGKDEGDVFIQDLAITYHKSDAFNLDFGLLLIENSYNSNQSAASLLPPDYGAYSFIKSGPLDERVGRDYGIRARGYLADGHVEYRAGVYQGLRDADSTNSFRFVGRLMYNVFEAQKGLFYTGSSLGTKKIVSFGASYDTQDEYDATGLDVFVDLPVSGGDGITFQADWVTYDGGSFIPSFSKQDTLLAELGYYSKSTKLLPFVQYQSRDWDDPAIIDEDRLQVGLGYLLAGNNRAIKLSWTRITRDGFADRDQIWLNFQLFVF